MNLLYLSEFSCRRVSIAWSCSPNDYCAQPFDGLRATWLLPLHVSLRANGSGHPQVHQECGNPGFRHAKRGAVVSKDQGKSLTHHGTKVDPVFLTLENEPDPFPSTHFLPLFLPEHAFGGICAKLEVTQPFTLPNQDDAMFVKPVAQKLAFLSGSVLLASAGVAAAAQDTLVSIDQVRVVGFIPLSIMAKHSSAPIKAVDPLAVYSNVTTFSGSSFAQGAALAGITRMVMDDVTFTTNPGVSQVTSLRFSVANQNASDQSVRARIRFWNADGASLGAGLPNGPGTYYAPGGTAVGYSFAAITFAPGVTTLTGTGVAIDLPAGTTTTLWAGITFDNVGTTTGATETELSNFGQGMFGPVDLGSSTDTVFETTAAGSFFNTANPAGAALNFSGTPAANMGWEFVVNTLPVELTKFTVD